MKKLTVLILIMYCLLPRLCSGEAVTSVPTGPIASIQILDNQQRPLRTFLSTRQTYATPVPLAEVSAYILQAVQTAEDRRFYRHSGIDIRAIFRALWQNICAFKTISGASTITQQLARALHPHKKTWWGKWTEAWDALKLEHHYSKDEILEQYLNILEFGNHTQGIEAAAQFYFGVPASEVSLAQGALLAGLIQSPTRLNPLKNPKGALARRNRILHRMYQAKQITQEQYQLAIEESIGIQAAARAIQAPHFVRFLQRFVAPGTMVHTFLDADLQYYAEQAIQNHLAQLAEEYVTNAAAIVLDNQTGGVLAYVGSADFENTQHAGQVDGVLAKRQPGSALKPFVYGLALQNGFTAASILRDEDTFFEGGFRPRNYDKTFHGNISLRKALACSYNVPVIKVAEVFGAGRILQLLHDFGFASLKRSADFYGLAIALGTGEVSLLELANAYRSLARGGKVRPVVFAQEPYLPSSTAVRQALPEDISYILTDILSDNAARADAFGVNSALQFPFPVAAKTGTSKDYKDNFAIAYTPRITVAVWAGNFDSSSMRKVSGVTGAAPIMHDIMMYAQTRYPGGNFDKPEDIIQAKICTHTGLLAGEHCTATREEIFTRETLPTAVCSGEHQTKIENVKITFPLSGDVFTYDKSLPAESQQLHFTAEGANTSCVWKVNAKPLAGRGAEIWWPLQTGRYSVQVDCGNQQDTTSFTVL